MDATTGGMSPGRDRAEEPASTGDGAGPTASAISRRDLLKTFGAGAAVLGASRLGDVTRPRRAPHASTSSTVVIGYVTPETGSLAGFSLADKYVLGKVRSAPPYKNGVKVGSRTYKLEIVPVDSQSDPSRASTVAKQLIQQNKADIIVTSSAPETTNPVALTCEQLHVPSLATVVPWESWYAGLGGNPLKPTTKFAYASMFFFGMKEFAGTFLPMWKRVESQTHAAKIFAGMFPNDADGNAFRAGFPPFAEAAGYKFVDGGAYTDLTQNYSSMISKFKSSGAEFFVNCPLPPDFNTFWKEAVQQGFRPRLATVAKVLLFPADVAALGSLANNIATDAWWTPYAPYRSSMTGETTKAFATGYQDSSGQEWIQSMGSTYSLFEVVVEALKLVDDPHDKAQLAAALHKVHYSGLTGPLNFATGPAPGVAIVKPVGIQWKPGTNSLGKKFPFQPFVVDNSQNPAVPINGDLVPTNP